MKIKKFAEIKNMAVFKDFKWDANIQNNEFKDVNIIYGANYSGKTTLSRILRGFETKIISDKYKDFSFKIETDNAVLNESNYVEEQNGLVVRVFNEDFARDNFGFFTDPNSKCNASAFAVVGEKNKNLAEEIKKLESKLGENKDIECTGLYLDLKKANDEFQNKYNEYENKDKDFKELKHNKATKSADSIKIKFSSMYYNINKLDEDINVVKSGSYVDISNDEREKLEKSLKEEEKQEPLAFNKPNFQLKYLQEQCRNICEKEVINHKSLEEFIQKPELESWVQKGLKEYNHKGGRCAFCGELIKDTRWDALTVHFNNEMSALYDNIKTTTEQIKKEQEKIKNLNVPSKEYFYVCFHTEYDSILNNYKELQGIYSDKLGWLLELLEKKYAAIHKKMEFSYDDGDMDFQALDKIFLNYEVLRKQSIEYGKDITQKKKEAKEKLILAEIKNWMMTINYDSWQEKLIYLEKEKEESKNKLDKVEKEIKDIELQIKEKQQQMEDEGNGARAVENYLNMVFGDKHFQLEVVRKDETGGKEVYFEIKRDGNPAYNLSEGERNLIAFCYFVAKLHDKNTKGKKPVIWIDDPISSLDGNNIYFLFSLIQAVIIKEQLYGQLFISTHNLMFLKYLFRLHKVDRNNMMYYFIERIGGCSILKKMPNYLKRYGSEFQEWFKIIYKCSLLNENQADNEGDLLALFPNTARKFLEVYFCFKYPHDTKEDKSYYNYLAFFDNQTVNTDSVQKNM